MERLPGNQSWDGAGCNGSYPALPTWSVSLINNTLRNGSFELLTVGGVPTTGLTAKASNWDTDPDGDVTDWSPWTAETTANTDSGSEVACRTPRTG